MPASRRDFLRALALGTGAILVPQYGGWYRQGSGLLAMADSSAWTLTSSVHNLTTSTLPLWDVVSFDAGGVTLAWCP